MSRIFRFVVPAVLIAPVVALATRLLVAPISDDPHYQGTGMPGPERIGWPWEFADLPSGWDANPPWNWWLLGADLVIIGLAIVGLLFLIVRWQKNHFRIQFSIRALLVLVTCVAIPAGWLAHEYSEWKSEQLLLQSLQDKVFGQSDYCGPEWLRRLWNAHDLTMFYRTTRIGGTVEDDIAKKLGDMKELSALDIDGVSDQALAYLARCRSIRNAGISGNAISDRGIAWLANWDSLDTISLEAPALSDAGVASIAKCKRLESLSLIMPALTDAGVASLTKCSRLESLSLSAPALTDASIQSICQLRSLKMLDLSACNQLTDRGIRELIKLPKLESVQFPRVPDLTEETFNQLVDRFSTPLSFPGSNVYSFNDLRPREAESDSGQPQ